MDFISGLPKSEGKEVIMVVVDRLTKYAHLLALKHPFKASDVAQLFLDNVYKLHGMPMNIVSDRDPIFACRFWQELMLKLGVRLNMSTAYHPQTDGQTEKVNQCIENYLRCMLHNQPKQWCKWLPLAEYWYNTNYHASLKTTPFQAMYGYAPPQLPLGSPPKCAIEGVDAVLKERHLWLSGLKRNLQKAQERMKKFADNKRSERTFQVGDWVFLKLQPYRQITVQDRKNFKLSSKYYGPFEIIAKVGEVAYKLNLPQGSQIHPVFHVSQLKAKVGDTQAVEPGFPVMNPQRELEEEPEGILGRRMVKKKNAYATKILIKWKGKSEEEASWEDYEEIGKKFPAFILRDKDNFKGEGMSGNQLHTLKAVKSTDSDSLKTLEREMKGNERLIGGAGAADGMKGSVLLPLVKETLTDGPGVKWLTEKDGNC